MNRARTQRVLQAMCEVSRSPRAAVEAEVADSRGLTPTQQGARLAAVCRAAWAVLRTRPDFHRIVTYADPLPKDFAEKWQVLVARRRAQRGGNHGSC